MIAVIADDFTGAAEIGGIALKYGLKVIIETKVKKVSDADLLIIATDTRSLSADEGSSQIEKITKKLTKLNPEFIYKKLDSVLRGNIDRELLAQMYASGKKRAVIVAGNPIFGRLVKNGVYTIDSVPLSETHFANDPDFPVKSSLVVEIFKNACCHLESKKVNDDLPSEGLIIGDVCNFTDMQRWVPKVMDKSTIAAGGAGFFDVILNTLFTKVNTQIADNVQPGSRTLLVFGSAYPKSSSIKQRLNEAGIVKKNMPEEIFSSNAFNPDIFENWIKEVVNCLSKNQKTLISIDFQYNSEEGLAERIKGTIAELVKRVMKEVELNSLFIEGGATTSEILQSLKIAKLYPYRELDLGIIQMKTDKYPNLCITTKPGSYSWPQNISFENTQPKTAAN